MTRAVLMVAYHFPPFGVSSGVQRTLCFSRYLAEHHWRPLVLSASPRAYSTLRHDQVHEIPAAVIVRRAFALDTARHLALRGRYPGWLALPDRWVSWIAGGVWAGWRMIREYRPRALWSTYPIASAHLIGLVLHRLSGIPWVADCRDSMLDDSFPEGRAERRVFRWLERRIVDHAAAMVFTAEGTRDLYARRFPGTGGPGRFVVPNGFDEESFGRAEARPPPARDRGRRTLVHSGNLHPRERDPGPFLEALAGLRRRGAVDPGRHRVVLRATGYDAAHADRIRDLGLDDVVELAGPVDYEEALREMLDADGLLLFQGASCNHQVPAKVYEYLRAGRPVLAVVDEDGDTARLLREVGSGTVVPIADRARIEAGLAAFLRRLETGNGAGAGDRDGLAGFSRRAQAGQLAGILDGVAGAGAPRTSGSGG